MTHRDNPEDATLDTDELNAILYDLGPEDTHVEIIDAGVLSLPSGQVIAAEPYLLRWSSCAPLRPSIAPGHYSVRLFAGITETGDRRIGLAALFVSDRRAVRWARATVMNDGEVKPAFSGSDGALGGFFDATAEALIREIGKTDEEFIIFLNAMQPTYRHTREWANVPLGDSHNVIMFSSGWGDGNYPTYVGFDDAGDVACFITDFKVFELHGEAGAD